MWFVHLWGMNCHVDMFQEMITYSMKLFMAIGILFFRKPPDIYVQFDDVIIGAQRRCLMDYLFTWIQWRKEMSADETELGRTMRKEVAQQEKLCAFMAQQENDTNKESSWSSDAFPIVIDTAASKTITPCFQDLIDPVEYKSSLNGIGQGAITHRGKIRWTVVDDAGKQVILEDDEAYFSASAPYRLLSPHSWKKYQDRKRFAQGETEGDKANFMLDETGDGYVLIWNRGRIQVSVPLDETTNLPTISSTGTYKGFCAFAAAFRCHPTIIPDDDDQEQLETMPLTEQEPMPIPDTTATPHQIPFSLEKNVNEQSIHVDDPLTQRDEALFLSWHLKLGHLSFRILRWIAKLGLIPKKLQHCRNVVCPACLYGKQKR